jgi:hypothetical protein
MALRFDRVNLSSWVNQNPLEFQLNRRALRGRTLMRSSPCRRLLSTVYHTIHRGGVLQMEYYFYINCRPSRLRNAERSKSLLRRVFLPKVPCC